jgi:hypothetical protein
MYLILTANKGTTKEKKALRNVYKIAVGNAGRKMPFERQVNSEGRECVSKASSGSGFFVPESYS